jgi:hypothetical protein
MFDFENCKIIHRETRAGQERYRQTLVSVIVQVFFRRLVLGGLERCDGQAVRRCQEIGIGSRQNACAKSFTTI